VQGCLNLKIVMLIKTVEFTKSKVISVGASGETSDGTGSGRLADEVNHGSR
jgi:hypothetical protein